MMAVVAASGVLGGAASEGHQTHPFLGAYKIAIWIAIVSIAMLFLALTAVMVARAEESSE